MFVKNFFIKAAYGLIANVATMLSLSASTYQPEGDVLTVYLWNSVVVGLFTGAAATLKRFVQSKAK